MKLDITYAKLFLIFLGFILFSSSCVSQVPNDDKVVDPSYERLIFGNIEPINVERMEKGDDYWKNKLTPSQFYILRQEGTEQPGTGKYNKFEGEGIFVCAGCDMPLYHADHKYDSGCGWPSFYRPLAPGLIEYRIDNSLWMQRIEVVCMRCEGHQGHIFEDGPRPTGLRYCINSEAMRYVPVDSAEVYLERFGIVPE